MIAGYYLYFQHLITKREAGISYVKFTYNLFMLLWNRISSSKLFTGFSFEMGDDPYSHIWQAVVLPIGSYAKIYYL